MRRHGSRKRIDASVLNDNGRVTDGALVVQIVAQSGGEGTAAAVRSVLRAHGPAGLFVGFRPAIVRDLPSYPCYFCVCVAPCRALCLLLLLLLLLLSGPPAPSGGMRPPPTGRPGEKRENDEACRAHAAGATAGARSSDDASRNDLAANDRRFMDHE